MGIEKEKYKIRGRRRKKRVHKWESAVQVVLFCSLISGDNSDSDDVACMGGGKHEEQTKKTKDADESSEVLGIREEGKKN